MHSFSSLDLRMLKPLKIIHWIRQHPPHKQLQHPPLLSLRHLHLLLRLLVAHIPLTCR